MAVDYPKPLLIFGAGPFAELMHHHFSIGSSARVAAFTVDREYVTTDSLRGLPVLPFDAALAAHPPEACDLFLAVGYKDLRVRARLFEKARSAGYRMTSFLDPRAHVYEPESLGENCVVLGNAVVEPFCTLGDNNILWSGSTVCHGTRMGSHNFLAAGVVVGGECRIGDRCFFGFSSTVREKVSVADETLLGAQSLLLQDTAPFGAYLGVPARRRGEHEAEGLRIGR